MKTLARRKARGPRWGEVIEREGVATTIARIPLYQPGAPKFYEVTDSEGRTLFVEMKGAKWVEYGFALKAATAELRGAAEPKPDAAALKQHLAAMPVPASVITDQGGVEFFKALARQSRGATLPASTKEDVTYVPARTVRPGGRHQTLHDQLDRARDAYSRARDGERSDERIMATFATYTALIAEVNRRDPEFYEGRRR